MRCEWQPHEAPFDPVRSRPSPEIQCFQNNVYKRNHQPYRRRAPVTSVHPPNAKTCRAVALAEADAKRETLNALPHDRWLIAQFVG
jgi:hypothetical protein